MAEVTRKDPNENSNLKLLIDALNVNNLSDEYKKAFIKVAVTLDEFKFANFDISKLEDFFRTVKITDFPIAEIESSTKDIVPYLLGTSIEKITGTGFGNQGLNKGINDSLVQLFYPTEKELTDEACVFNLMVETLGLDTMLTSYIEENPNLIKNALLKIIPDMQKLEELLKTIEVNHLDKQGPSKLGEIQKTIIDYFSKLSGLDETKLANFSSKMIDKAEYFEDPERYQSLSGVLDYYYEALGIKKEAKTI